MLFLFPSVHIAARMDVRRPFAGCGTTSNLDSDFNGVRMYYYLSIVNTLRPIPPAAYSMAGINDWGLSYVNNRVIHGL